MLVVHGCRPWYHHQRQAESMPASTRISKRVARTEGIRDDVMKNIHPTWAVWHRQLVRLTKTLAMLTVMAVKAEMTNHVTDAARSEARDGTSGCKSTAAFSQTATAEPMSGGWRNPPPEHERFDTGTMCSIERVPLRVWEERYARGNPEPDPVVIVAPRGYQHEFRTICARDELLRRFQNKIVTLSSANSHSYDKERVEFGRYVNEMIDPVTSDVRNSALCFNAVAYNFVNPLPVCVCVWAHIYVRSMSLHALFQRHRIAQK